MARPADPTVHDALLSAALLEFSAVGVHRARIEDITARAGVSKGAFYLHFESKEALLDQALTTFFARMEGLSRTRVEEMEAFARGGPPTAADFAGETPRGRELLALEARHDRLALELLWEERHLFDVMLRGCKGTRFDGQVWELTSREMSRVQAECERLQATGCCRADIPSDVFAQVLVGAWLMIVRQMSGLSQKPDLEAWLSALHRLIREGAAPRATVPPAAPPSPARISL